MSDMLREARARHARRLDRTEEIRQAAVNFVARVVITLCVTAPILMAFGVLVGAFAVVKLAWSLA